MKLNFYDETYDLKLKRQQYSINRNLAIELFEEDEAYPFAVITVNTDRSLPENQAFVDVNNCEWAEDFIKKYELGKPTGDYISSGFVDYPLYEFDMNKLLNK